MHVKVLNFDKAEDLKPATISKLTIPFLYTILCYDVKIILNYKLLNYKNQVGTGC